MKATFRSPRKLVTVVGMCLVVIFVVHQLSFNDQFVLSDQLSKSMTLVGACPRPTFQTDNESLWGVGSGIPNLVHQIWKTDDVYTYSAEASHESWKATVEPMNYKVKLWTDDDVLRLIEVEYPWLLSTYEGYSQNIQRADVARLVVVHSEGGIYADLDVYIESAVELLCLQNLGLRGIFAPTTGNLGFSNHFFMAERGSEFLQWALYEAKRRGEPSKQILLPYLRVFWSTGPLMVTSAFRQYSWMYSTSDHKLGVLDEGYGGLVVRHAAGRSWHGFDGYILNYLADHVQAESLWVDVFWLAAILALVCILLRYRQRNACYRRGRAYLR